MSEDMNEHHIHATLDRWEEARRVFEDPATTLADVKAAMQSVMRDLIACESVKDGYGPEWKPKPYPAADRQAA